MTGIILFFKNELQDQIPKSKVKFYDLFHILSYVNSANSRVKKEPLTTSVSYQVTT